MTTKQQTRDSDMSAITVVEFERPTLQSETYLAELAEEGEDTGPPYTIHGVALGAGDVTKGKSGLKKKWPGEELEQAAETLQGQSLVVNHENTAEGVVGKVTKAGYKDGTGVVYEAQLYDEDLAEKVQDGLLEVSVRGLHADIESLSKDDETDAIKVEDIEFKNLSIVPSGAAPSNTLEMGEHAELSEAELSSFTESLDAAELADLEPGDWVQWGDDNYGIIMSPTDGKSEVEVNLFHKDGDMWRPVGESETVSLDSLEAWDVDEENVGGKKDEENSSSSDSESDNSDEEENADTEEELIAQDDKVQWDSSGGLAKGIIVDRQESGCFEDRIDGDMKVCADDDEAALLIRVVQEMDDGSYKRGDTMVAHKEGSVEQTDFDMRRSAEENSAVSRGQYVKWRDMDNNWRHGQIIGVEQEGSQFVATLRRFTESGDKLDETSEKPVQGLDPWDNAPVTEENETDESGAQSDSEDSDDGADSMQFSDGQMVEWQVNSDMFGKIVHIDQQDGKIMVEVMRRTDDGVESTNHTVTAGFSDLVPRDSEEMSSTTKDVPTQDTSSEHDGMGDDLLETFLEQRGADASFEEFLDWLREADLASFERGEGEEKPLDSLKDLRESWARDSRFIETEAEDFEELTSTDEGETPSGETMSQTSDVEELQDYEMHTPDWSGTTESDWSTPDMEDFDTDDLGEIASHFLISATGFPPENFTDLKLPVVEPNGDLNVNALAAVKGGRGASSVDGLSDEMEQDIIDWVNSTANDEFDRNWGEEEASENSIEGTEGEPTSPTKSVGGVRVLPGDDLLQEYKGESETDSMTQYKVTTTMDEQIEEKLSQLDDPVAVEAEELSDLKEKADRFDELSENVEAIRERTEILDDVDRDNVEELRDADDPVVVESARYEELESEAEQVKDVYAASLAEHMPGFEAEELSNSFDIDSLREKHEEVVGELEEELSASSEDAEPRSQDPSEEELEEASTENKEEEELADEAAAKQDEILTKITEGRL